MPVSLADFARTTSSLFDQTTPAPAVAYCHFPNPEPAQSTHHQPKSATTGGETYVYPGRAQRDGDGYKYHLKLCLDVIAKQTN
jgi:hypothetical protein